MPIFRRVGEKPLSLAFQCLILMICDLNLVMILSLASKGQHFKVGMPVFQPFYVMKLKTSKFKESNTPTLWNIGILHYKQAKLPIHLQHSVHTKENNLCTN